MIARSPHNVNSGPTPSEVSQAARVFAHKSWALTTDRTARTAKARATFQQKFLDQAEGDPVRAESLRKAYYASMALKSARTRRLNREAREGGAAA